MEVMPTPSAKPSTNWMEGKTSKTSKILRLLIKICYLPVSIKNEKVVFKILSFKTFVYIICSVLWIIFMQSMMQFFMDQEDFDQFLAEV